MEACQGLHVRKRKEVKNNWGDFPRKIFPAKLGDRKLLVLGCSLAGYILSFISLSQSWVLSWSVKKVRKAKWATLGVSASPSPGCSWSRTLQIHPGNFTCCHLYRIGLSHLFCLLFFFVFPPGKVELLGWHWQHGIHSLTLSDRSTLGKKLCHCLKSQCSCL